MIEVKDIAVALGCSESHVRRLARRPDFPPSFKLGRLRRWKVKDIEAWVAKQQVRDTPAPRAPSRPAVTGRQRRAVRNDPRIEAARARIRIAR